MAMALLPITPQYILNMFDNSDMLLIGDIPGCSCFNNHPSRPVVIPKYRLDI
jgi:hypothetical protein